jgi:predicted alpha/beta-fold hydrolase
MNYKPSHLFFRNGHYSTIVPSLFRKIEIPKYQRLRLKTPDLDFIDIDLCEKNASQKIVIFLHGLEGSSYAHYISSHAKFFLDRGFNTCALNFRSCSGEMNKTTRLYHSGETQDLRFLLSQPEIKKYHEIYLVGFSLGGNVVLKYLCEEGQSISSKICSAASVSAPVDLESSSLKMARGFNLIYSLHFMKSLREKVKKLKIKHPDIEIQEVNPKKLITFYDFDNLVTAPLHGFDSAQDYWKKCSTAKRLSEIKIPTLLLSSYDDPILGPECFPRSQNPFITTHYTRYGGHIGFVETKMSDFMYSEKVIFKHFI